MIHHAIPGAKFFKPYMVKLLVDIPGTDYKAGDIISAEDIPNGTVHLLDLDGRICESKAIKGKTFV